MGDKPFLWIANKDQPETLFAEFCPNAQRLPNAPHGLNDYQSIDNVAVLSALNPSPQHFAFLMNHEHLKEAEIQTAIAYHTYYQAVMRSSLRDPDNRNEKTVIVPDKDAAEWLSGLLPGSAVESLGIELKPKGKPGQPIKYDTDAEKKQTKRNRQKIRQQLDDLISRLGHTGNRGLGLSMTPLSPGMSIGNKGVIENSFRLATFPNQLSTTPSAQLYGDSFLGLRRSGHRSIWRMVERQESMVAKVSL
jgi:hypothetical protein